VFAPALRAVAANTICPFPEVPVAAEPGNRIAGILQGQGSGRRAVHGHRQATSRIRSKGHVQPRLAVGAAAMVKSTVQGEPSISE